MNTTVVHARDFHCSGAQDDFLRYQPQDVNATNQQIAGRFVIYADDIWAYSRFRKCDGQNYWTDQFSNAGYFAHWAQVAGAAGLIVNEHLVEENVCYALMSYNNELTAIQFNGFRVAGFTKHITIPVLVTSKATIQSLESYQDEVGSLIIPAILPSGKRIVTSVRSITDVL